MKRLITIPVVLVLGIVLTGAFADEEGKAVESPPTPPKLLIQEWEERNTKSKLSSMAFEKEGVIVKSLNLSDEEFVFHIERDFSGVFVEFLGEKSVRRNLESLHRFVEEGGRAAVLLSRRYAKHNGDFQELFSVSIMMEGPLVGEKEYKVKGEEYSPLFNGLTVVVGFEAFEPRTIRSSLVAVGNEWVRTPINIKGEKKFLSAWRKLGKGEVLFLTTTETTLLRDLAALNAFFNDSMIELGQNMEASMCLVRWLAGKAEYPMSKE